MGAAQQVEIVGAKGGSDKPKTPTEAPDSLRSVAMAKILIAMGEGEFAGNPTAQDIYLDNTPLQDPQGNMNFPNVRWEYRGGSVEQGYIQGIPSIENETSLGIELRSGTPWVRAINNTELSAVRVRFAWPALQSIDASGNVNGYRIEYKVELATDGGAYQQVLSEAVDGKTTSTYERTRRIDLQAATSGWLMRITRITPNQNNNKIADTMQIAGFTEVIDAKLSYPNTALLYIEFSAEQFRNIPAVTVDCRARKWQVPSNYDPDSRSYTDIWDGTFKLAWTDNPAWVTYGITVNDRFGLGRRIKSWQVDKWELYRIAQYCDQLVPDGKGGQEPRFICNLNLQGKADAWSLLRDISAIYRGMTYWAQGQLFSLSDMPRATDFDFAYTRANVIDGKFTYSSASERTRYSRALISYDNPANNYDTDVTSVTDPKLQRRYGDNPLEIGAIGCTRESEAQRRGKWALLTNSKDRAVSFKVGLDGRIPLPGYVIPVADELLAGRAIGGRISAVAGRTITLDRDTQAKAGDRLILNLPNGKCEGRTVQSVAGRAVTVTIAYSAVPERELVWALDADELAVPLYRVTAVSRPEPGVFEISAVQYDPSKFAFIDTGARLEERPISVIPITAVPAPASVTLSASSVVSQGIAVATMTITWPAVNGAVGYDVEWRKDSGNWIKMPRTGATGVDVVGIYAGAYVARIRAVSAFDISSIWRNSILTNLKGKEGLPPAVSSLTATPLLFGIYLKWGFPAGAEDSQRTEIWHGPTTSLEAATKLADLAYPQNDYSLQHLQSGARLFFWVRLIDRTGNVGPFYPTGLGVMGQASADAGPILDQIAGQISESELGGSLLGRIDLIDGPATLPGSVSNRLNELDERVGEGQAALQQQIDQVNTIAKSGEYQKEKAYDVGASTRLDDRLYQAKIAVPADVSGAKSPPDATYWMDVGQVVSDSNGLAARVNVTESKITSIEGVNTSQGTAITGLNNSLTTTNTNVTAAQNAANAANTLAGGKGKVLVQTAAPAAADQLAQNLWIDITGGANTPKRWIGSAWAAVTDKVATDAAAAAANALTQVATKAEAATVTALSNTVTQQGDAITAQGQSLTGIQASIGGLGAAGTNLLVDKYSWLTSPTLPATVSGSSLARIGVAVAEASSGYGIKMTTASTSTSQFLMLSPTNNLAGWNIDMEAGTYLVSMYVQASAAGAMRVSMYNGSHRYSANATYSTTRQRLVFVCTTTAFARAAITIYPNMSALAAGTEITIDSVMIEKMAGANTSTTPSPFVAGNSAASVSGQAAATSALDARVSQTETGLTSQGSQLTSLSNTVVGKADNSALQSLASTVSQQGDTLTSQGSAVTQLQSTVGAIGGNGVNLLPGEYTAFSAAPPIMQKVSTTVVTTEADATAYTGYLLKVSATAATVGYVYLASSATDYNLKLKPGKKYIFSLKAKGSVTHNVGVRIRYLNAAGGVVETSVGTIAVGTDLASYSAVITAPAALVERAQVLLFTQNTAAIGDTWLDAVMLEAQVGTATTPSEFTPGASVRQAYGQATAISSLDTRVTDTEGQITAQATKLDGIFAQVNPPLAGDSSDFAGSTASFVGVWSEQSARIEDGVALGQRIDVVTASVGVNSAAIQTETTTRATADSALASQITTVQAVANSASAAVQTVSQAQASTDGKLGTMWSVKMQVNAQGQYVAAGIGLGIENTGAGLQSTFLVSADTFAVVNGINGTLSSPFAVTGGQVFIRDAFIANGSITMLKIGDSLQSDDYVAGTSGWKLTKAGIFEINGTIAGQGKMTMTNRALKVYDGSNVLRVQLGDLTA